MRKMTGAAVLVLGLATAVPAGAADVPTAPLTVTNTTDHVADCAVLIDGRIKYYIKLQPGRTWTDKFQTIRELKLVCERSREMYWGPLKLGGSYNITRVHGRFEIAEAANGRAGAGA